MHQTTTEPALTLAAWLLAVAPARPDPLTHLKLQKLAFYCYGGLLAFDLEGAIGPVDFQAWKHGPVSPPIYGQYSHCGRNALPHEAKPTILDQAELVLAHVLNVYGRLSAWQLREESHSEEPWRARFDGSPHALIPQQDMRAHFKQKFIGGPVRFPERLFGGSSMMLDRIPVPTFPTLWEMSAAVSRILG